MSALQQLFAAPYSATALSIATALVAVSILLLGIGALARGRSKAPSLLFFAVTTVGACWLGSFSAMYAATEAATALSWGRTGFFFSALIPAAVFHFASTLATRRRRRHRVLSILFWAFSLAVGLVGLVTDLLIPGVRRFAWGHYPMGRPFDGVIVVVFSAMIIASIVLLLRTYRRAEGRARERAGALLLAFSLGSLCMFDYLPSVGIAMQPIGSIAALAFVIIAATAVWRFDFADITPEFAAGQILETMKGAVIVADMSGVIRVVNRAAATMLGYSQQQLRGVHLRQVLPRDQNMTTGQLINSLGVLEQTMAWQAADGTKIDVLASSSFLRDQDDVPVAVVYVASDFTERKRAEEALRESEHRYRTLFETNPLPMWVYDPATLRFIAVNDAAVRHYGYSREEFHRMTIADIRPAEDVDVMLNAVAHLTPKTGPRHFRHRRKGGEIFDAEITSFEFVSGGRRSRMAIAQDVTARKKAEDELRESEQRYRELFENAHDIVYTHDLEGRVTSMNLAGERTSGYAREEILGRNIESLLAPEHLDRARDAMQRKLRGEAAATFYEIDMLSKDGRRIPVELSTRLIHRDGKPIGVQGIGRDMTERKASEAIYRLLFERNLAGVYRTTVEGRVLECNDACARIFGFDSREEFLARHAGEAYFDEVDRDRIVQLLREHGQVSNLEVRLRRRDGSAVWVLENVALLDGDILEGTIIDITDRKLAQEQMEYQAYHDALTGLPNRLLFRDRITVALAHARRTQRSCAVLFFDLDQFKHVNDTLGHTIGDRLLQAIAARLVTCVRAEDTVARMGGDEFTILLSDITDRRNAAAVAQKVLDAVRHPVIVDDHELFASTSIGISIFPDDGDDAETLLKTADRAMYRAKELGRDNYQYATSAKLEIVDSRVSFERSLHAAMQRDEFVVHYQPMVEIASGRVVGAEALLRWNHPEKGIVQPDEFIPVAEETQLIIPLGAWVLRTACAQMKEWHDGGHPWLRVAVNLSPRQFLDRALVTTVEQILAETGFPASCLDVEITESTAMQNADQTLAILKQLKEMGVSISIDDFGTGYSSLSYLKRFPIDTVKIDQDFVRDLTRDDAAIISAVISMARALNLRVVAEGVETEEQLAFLRSERCAEMQGFLYSEPLTASDFALALRATAAAPDARLGPLPRLTID